MKMLCNDLASNDGDDITFSSLTMRTPRWSYDSLQSDLRNVALLSYLFCFPKHLTAYENGTFNYWQQVRSQ